MILPSESPNGPDSSYIANGNSTCSDQTYTLFAPGTQGGLMTGGYQPAPSPAFDSSGNALANQIVQPVAFFGVRFAVDTASEDAQTGLPVPSPSISVDSSGNLSGNVEAFDASWNKQYFNQGSPKPGGTLPGLTAGPTGTYTSSTGAFTLDWTSQIVGGPFNGFTGQWHFVGTFESAPAPTTTTTTPSPTRSVVTATSTPVAKSAVDPSSKVDATSPDNASVGSSPLPGVSTAVAATPDAGSRGTVLASTGMSIPLWIPIPPLAVGGLLFAVSRRRPHHTHQVSR